MSVLDIFNLSVLGVPGRAKAIPLDRITTMDQVLDYASGGTWASVNYASKATSTFKTRWMSVAALYADVYKRAKPGDVTIGTANDVPYWVSQLALCDRAASALRREETPTVPIVEGAPPPPPSTSLTSLSALTNTTMMGVPLIGLLAVIGGVVFYKLRKKS